MEELRYIRHGKPIPDGWELVADFEDCHHGRYSQGIIRKIQKPEPDPNLCQFCHQTTQVIEVHGHTQCAVCRTVVGACCGGASNGEAG